MRKLILHIMMGLVFIQCQHETVIPDSYKVPEQSTHCDSDTIYFVNDVLPLLMSSCATTGCHDDQTAEHGVRLTSYSSIIQTGEVKPFKPNDSELYEVLFENGDDLMPPPPMAAFSDEKKEIIKNWILQGARNNECIEDCDILIVSFASDIAPIISTSCLSCHGSVFPNGGVSLTNYSEIATLANSGKLLDVLKAQNGAPLMPPSSALNNCKMNKITKWIEDGTPNN